MRMTFTFYVRGYRISITVAIVNKNAAATPVQ